MSEFEPQSNKVSVAKQMTEDIISYCNNVPEHRWPPTSEGMTAKFGDAPDSVKLSMLLAAENRRANREKAYLIIDSITPDFFIKLVIERLLPQILD